MRTPFACPTCLTPYRRGIKFRGAVYFPGCECLDEKPIEFDFRTDAEKQADDIARFAAF